MGLGGIERNRLIAETDLKISNRSLRSAMARNATLAEESFMPVAGRTIKGCLKRRHAGWLLAVKAAKHLRKESREAASLTLTSG